MIVLLDLVNQFSMWSGIHLNVNKFKITTFVYEFQAIPRKRDRDDALQARLAYVNMVGQPIGSLSQYEPLPRGYQGTSLTASLCPDAHIRRTKEQEQKIDKALARAPLCPHNKQRLLLYGAHSKIAHTHCLMALSLDAMKEIDSLLEKISIKIWGLPTSLPRTGLHAPIEEIGLNIPLIWEDFCGTALKFWTHILNGEGALGTTARPSLHGAAY